MGADGTILLSLPRPSAFCHRGTSRHNSRKRCIELEAWFSYSTISDIVTRNRFERRQMADLLLYSLCMMCNNLRIVMP